MAWPVAFRRSLASLGKTRRHKESGVMVLLWRSVLGAGCLESPEEVCGAGSQCSLGATGKWASSSILKEEQDVAAHRPPGQRGGSPGQGRIDEVGHVVGRPACEESGLKLDTRSIESALAPQQYLLLFFI